MKVHRATLEGLIDLYIQCHTIFDEEYNAEKEGEDAMEAAAMDYMTSPVRVKFCGIVDNLDHEVCRELVALMVLGRDSRSVDDFDELKEHAAIHPETGNDLIGEQHLPEHWRKAMDLLQLV